MKNSNSLLILLLFVTGSCTKPSNFEKIESFYRQFKQGDFNRFKRVIVINEEGTCLKCNNIFAQTQAQKVDETENLFIVSGQGTRVDISAYISKNAPNLIMDYKNEFSKLNLVKGCTVFELENRQIIKTTYIQPGNVTEFGKVH
ncbi:hypothetical protein D3C87_431630 [compost metagenome]